MNKTVDYLVEADSATQMLVWLLLKDKTSYGQFPEGYQDCGVFAGKTKEQPNMVSLSYRKINNKIVCFYWGTSTIVNHLEIEDYLDHHFPNVRRLGADSFVISYEHFLEVK
ncbi:hypothetical protein VPHF99_0299 [Vibrio phage F99]